MAERIAINFRRSPKPSIVNYDFIDIASGKGYVEFMGVRVSISGTSANDDYLLVTNAMAPSETSTSVSTNGELFFDVKMNRTNRIDGNIYVVIPMHEPTASQAMTIQVAIDIVGTTTTNILAYTNTPSLTGTAYGERVFVANIDNKKIMAGETLRLKLKNTGTAGQVYHNPLGGNSNLTLTGGKLSFFVPFKVLA